MPKVLISDKMSPLAQKVFETRGVEVDYRPGLSPDDLKACIGAYDGLAIRSATKATAEVIAAADNLKVIGRAGIGVDNVDIPAATANGVVVMNAPFGNSITTAEHAIAMILSLARQIPQANASTHAAKWEKSRFMGVELMGKTLGLVGAGNIGGIVADRALGLRMKVIAYDPFLSQERAEELGIEKVDLDDLWARADVITFHTPLTDQTRNLVNAGTIAKMKTGVRIVNCARGGIIVEPDLKAALDAGKVAGAALDVFAQEPAKENILFGDERVICTPHLGASTTEAQEKVALQIAEQMADYLLTGAVVNALNMPSVSAEDAPKLKPYMTLAEQLGSFAGQITTSGLKGVTIEFEGAATDLNTKPVTAVILRGLLAPLMDTVNMVNAPVVAKERDISVTEVKHDRPCEYHTLIRLTVTTEQRSRTVSGTLFAGHPRIIEMEGIAVDAEISPHMLYIHNEDKPGFIGGVGTLLGDEGVNIATFHLGRHKDGAVALVSVDQPVDEALVAKVRELPQVNRVQALKF